MIHRRKEQPLTWQQQETRLAALKGSDQIVPFCTPAMRDRGTVYRCRIESDGNAIVVESSRWWAMSFSKTDERVGEVLGAVRVDRLGGSLDAGLYCGALMEGVG